MMLTADDAHGGRRAHAGNPDEVVAQNLQACFVEGGGLDVDARRVYLDGGHVDRAPCEHREHFVGDPDPVGEQYLDAHVASPY